MSTDNRTIGAAGGGGYRGGVDDALYPALGLLFREALNFTTSHINTKHSIQGYVGPDAAGPSHQQTNTQLPHGAIHSTSTSSPQLEATTISSSSSSITSELLFAKRLFGLAVTDNSSSFSIAANESDQTDPHQSGSHLLLLFALLVLINLIVILGNILVILAVYATAKLRNVTNIFIVSLATADLMLGVFVLPYALMFEILDVWIFGQIWCRGWLVTDVWISTASILNLCAISVDRYVAVTRPVKYRSIMTPRRAKTIVAGVWIVSFLICLPPLLQHWNPSLAHSTASSSSSYSAIMLNKNTTSPTSGWPRAQSSTNSHEYMDKVTSSSVANYGGSQRRRRSVEQINQNIPIRPTRREARKRSLGKFSDDRRIKTTVAALAATEANGLGLSPSIYVKMLNNNNKDAALYRPPNPEPLVSTITERPALNLSSTKGSSRQGQRRQLASNCSFGCGPLAKALMATIASSSVGHYQHGASSDNTRLEPADKALSASFRRESAAIYLSHKLDQRPPPWPTWTSNHFLLSEGGGGGGGKTKHLHSEISANGSATGPKLNGRTAKPLNNSSHINVFPLSHWPLFKGFMVVSHPQMATITINNKGEKDHNDSSGGSLRTKMTVPTEAIIIIDNKLHQLSDKLAASGVDLNYISMPVLQTTSTIRSSRLSPIEFEVHKEEEEEGNKTDQQRQEEQPLRVDRSRSLEPRSLKMLHPGSVAIYESSPSMLEEKNGSGHRIEPTRSRSRRRGSEQGFRGYVSASNLFIVLNLNFSSRTTKAAAPPSREAIKEHNDERHSLMKSSTCLKFCAELRNLLKLPPASPIRLMPLRQPNALLINGPAIVIIGMQPECVAVQYAATTQSLLLVPLKHKQSDNKRRPRRERVAHESEELERRVLRTIELLTGHSLSNITRLPNRPAAASGASRAAVGNAGLHLQPQFSDNFTTANGPQTTEGVTRRRRDNVQSIWLSPLVPKSAKIHLGWTSGNGDSEPLNPTSQRPGSSGKKHKEASFKSVGERQIRRGGATDNIRNPHRGVRLLADDSGVVTTTRPLKVNVRSSALVVNATEPIGHMKWYQHHHRERMWPKRDEAPRQAEGGGGHVLRYPVSGSDKASGSKDTSHSCGQAAARLLIIHPMAAVAAGHGQLIFLAGALNISEAALAKWQSFVADYCDQHQQQQKQLTKSQQPAAQPLVNVHWPTGKWSTPETGTLLASSLHETNSSGPAAETKSGSIAGDKDIDDHHKQREIWRGSQARKLCFMIQAPRVRGKGLATAVPAVYEEQIGQDRGGGDTQLNSKSNGPAYGLRLLLSKSYCRHYSSNPHSAANGVSYHLPSGTRLSSWAPSVNSDCSRARRTARLKRLTGTTNLLDTDQTAAAYNSLREEAPIYEHQDQSSSTGGGSGAAASTTNGLSPEVGTAMKALASINSELKYKTPPPMPQMNVSSRNGGPKLESVLASDGGGLLARRQKSGCALFDDKPYVIYSALGSFYIPMLVMIFFYSRIYLVASRAQKALQRGYMTTKWPLATGGGGAAAASGLKGVRSGQGGQGKEGGERVTLRIHRREKGPIVLSHQQQHHDPAGGQQHLDAMQSDVGNSAEANTDRAQHKQQQTIISASREAIYDQVDCLRNKNNQTQFNENKSSLLKLSANEQRHQLYQQQQALRRKNGGQYQGVNGNGSKGTGLNWDPSTTTTITRPDGSLPPKANTIQPLGSGPELEQKPTEQQAPPTESPEISGAYVIQGQTLGSLASRTSADSTSSNNATNELEVCHSSSSSNTSTTIATTTTTIDTNRLHKPATGADSVSCEAHEKLHHHHQNRHHHIHGHHHHRHRNHHHLDHHNRSQKHRHHHHHHHHHHQNHHHHNHQYQQHHDAQHHHHHNILYHHHHQPQQHKHKLARSEQFRCIRHKDEPLNGNRGGSHMKCASIAEEGGSQVNESVAAPSGEWAHSLESDDRSSISSVQITVSQYVETAEVGQSLLKDRSADSTTGSVDILPESNKCERSHSLDMRATKNPAGESGGSSELLACDQMARVDRSQSCGPAPTILLNWNPETGSAEAQLSGTKRPMISEQSLGVPPRNRSLLITGQQAPVTGSQGSGLSIMASLPMAANQVRKQSMMLLSSLTTRSSQTLRRLSMVASHPVDSLLNRSRSHDSECTSSNEDNANGATGNGKEVSSKRAKRRKRRKKKLSSSRSAGTPKKTFDDYLMAVAGIDGSSDEDPENGHSEGDDDDEEEDDEDEDDEDDMITSDDSLNYSLLLSRQLALPSIQIVSGSEPSEEKRQSPDTKGAVRLDLEETPATATTDRRLSAAADSIQMNDELTMELDLKKLDSDRPPSCEPDQRSLQDISIADSHTGELDDKVKPPFALHRKGAYYERATSRQSGAHNLSQEVLKPHSVVSALKNTISGPKQALTRVNAKVPLAEAMTKARGTRRRGAKRTSRWHAKRLHAETKAAKTVAIIIGGFIFCWLPFFIAYLSRAIICERPDCVPQSLLSLFIWLGYLNSAINPVIYGLFSADFRHAFKNILCRCRFRNNGDDTVVVSVLVDSIIKSIL